MMKMKKYLPILKEYPLSALMCLAADIFFTAKYSAVSAECEPAPIAYFIALYGSIMAILIFTAGWNNAKVKAERKSEERRRYKRRQAISALYSREFYSITEK